MAGAEVSSFLEIPTGTTVKVTVEGTTYDLGYVEEIHATSEDYVVWGDDNKRIWCESSNRELIKSEEFHQFWNRYQLTSCRSLHNLNEDATGSYRRMLSSAIASALERQFSAAAESLDAASGFLETANERVARSRYTLGAIAVAVAALALASLMHCTTLDSGSLLHQARVAILGGSIGALLSALANRRQRLGFDPDASVWEGRVNGGLRVVYGILSAFVVVLAIKSGAISTPLITQDNEPFSLIVVAVAGGFAERWAADLIQQFSSSSNQQP